MLYTLDGEIREITEIGEPAECRERLSDQRLAAYVTLKELKEIAPCLDIDQVVIEACEDVFAEGNTNTQNTMTASDDYSFGLINVLNVKDIFQKRDTIGLYLSQNLFVVIDLLDEDSSTKRAFARSLRQPGIVNKGIPRLFNMFIRELIRDHSHIYEKNRRALERLDNRIWKDHEAGEDSEFEEELSDRNHQLLLLYSYYQQLSEVTEELEENDNEIFDEDEIGHISSLRNRMDRYASNMNLLREYCQQIRESYQAHLDLYMNNIMKIFTVVTTIFLPLTLVVGWYGMNFSNMPELRWEYGYLTIIILSVVIVIGGILYFKKRRLL